MYSFFNPDNPTTKGQSLPHPRLVTKEKRKKNNKATMMQSRLAGHAQNASLKTGTINTKENVKESDLLEPVVESRSWSIAVADIFVVQLSEEYRLLPLRVSGVLASGRHPRPSGCWE
jgi:hypothetical protein